MKSLLSIALAFIIAASTEADQLSSEWQGKWFYDECWKDISGEQSNCVTYELEIHPLQTKSVSKLSINGFMSANEVAIEATTTDCGINITFIENTENSMQALSLKRGEVLFKLCKQGKSTITEWVNLEPNIKIENAVYFTKE
jgi:hypothetical protein